MSEEISLKSMFSMDHLQYKRVWLALGFFMLSLVLALSINSELPPLLKLIMMQDKVAHALAYASLMAWFAQIFRHDLTRLVLVIALTLFGLGMELVQSLVPSRQFDHDDMLANTLGIMCSWALAYTWVGNMFVKAEEAYSRFRVVSPNQLLKL